MSGQTTPAMRAIEITTPGAPEVLQLLFTRVLEGARGAAAAGDSRAIVHLYLQADAATTAATVALPAARLADEAEMFLLLIERIESDDPPRSGEYDDSKSKLVAAIQSVREPQ